MFKIFFNVIFVISGIIASFWKVFTKFHWHGQILTFARSLKKKFLARAWSFTNLAAQYWITGCGVSCSGIQNAIDLKVKCFKGFFEIFWNWMMASLQNLDQFLQKDFFKHNLYWNDKIVLLVKKSNQNFFRSCYLTKYFKIIWISQNLAFFKTIFKTFHFKRYWSFLWTHTSLG